MIPYRNYVYSKRKDLVWIKIFETREFLRSITNKERLQHIRRTITNLFRIESNLLTDQKAAIRIILNFTFIYFRMENKAMLQPFRLSYS